MGRNDPKVFLTHSDGVGIFLYIELVNYQAADRNMPLGKI